jgi:hypothetical protein
MTGYTEIGMYSRANSLKNNHTQSETRSDQPPNCRSWGAQISLIRSSIRADMKPATLSRRFDLIRAEIAAALIAED